jgi:hypothetical protein
MWIAVLVGIGGGLLVAMFIIARQEKRYRVLFSDTHLAELARAVEASRVGSPTRTFEGLTIAWERLPEHVALTLRCEANLAPPAARFLLSFLGEFMGAPLGKALQTDKRSFAALFARAEFDGERPVPTPTDEAIQACRRRAADAMRELTLVEGALSAFR